MIRTTGRLSFTSGYTTNVSTDRPSCFTVTHSPCRGDFASAAFAQSWAQAGPAPNPAKPTAKITATTTLKITRLISKLLFEKPPDFSNLPFIIPVDIKSISLPRIISATHASGKTDLPHGLHVECGALAPLLTNRAQPPNRPRSRKAHTNTSTNQSSANICALRVSALSLSSSS